VDVVRPRADEPILRLRNLQKSFGGSAVLRGAALDVLPGEVHALLGQNGSGKSTLIKVLSGFHTAEAGSEAWIDGEPIDLTRPGRDHERLRVVHQDGGQVLELSTVDNVGLTRGFAQSGMGTIAWGRQTDEARRMLEPFGVPVDVEVPLGRLSPLQRSIVAIASALQGWEGGRGILVLDEPTAALHSTEVTALFNAIEEVKRSGAGVIYVSHRMDEVFMLADRISVLRDGVVVSTQAVADTSPPKIASLMVGEQVAVATRRHAPPADGRTALEVRGLRSRYLHDVSLSVGAGEILGLAGLQGSGREDLARAIAGALDGPVSGSLRLGQAGPWFSIGGNAPLLPIVPADRLREGLLVGLSAGENLTLDSLSSLSRAGFSNHSAERHQIGQWFEKLAVAPPDPSIGVLALSGGNQQKLVLGRVLASNPSLVVLCDPTAGVDVATRQALYRLVIAEAAAGLAVVVASADLEDITSLCGRALVLRDGSIVNELQGESLTESRIIESMEGAGR
jgi:ABC-type sugar transport system ATPase subunit